MDYAKFIRTGNGSRIKRQHASRGPRDDASCCVARDVDVLGLARVSRCCRPRRQCGRYWRRRQRDPYRPRHDRAERAPMQVIIKQEEQPNFHPLGRPRHAGAAPRASPFGAHARCRPGSAALAEKCDRVRAAFDLGRPATASRKAAGSLFDRLKIVRCGCGAPVVCCLLSVVRPQRLRSFPPIRRYFGRTIMGRCDSASSAMPQYRLRAGPLQLQISHRDQCRNPDHQSHYAA